MGERDESWLDADQLAVTAYLYVTSSTHPQVEDVERAIVAMVEVASSKAEPSEALRLGIDRCQGRMEESVSKVGRYRVPLLGPWAARRRVRAERLRWFAARELLQQAWGRIT